MNNPHFLRALNEERLRLFVASAVGLFVAMLIGLVGVGFAGNPLKNLMLLFGGGMLVLASLKPHFGLHLLIVSSACLDLVKRFLGLFGVGSMGDVMGVLAVAPMILAGIFLGVFILHPIFTKRMLTVDERRLAILALLPIVFALAAPLRRGEYAIETLGAITNLIAYLLLLPIVFVLYRRKGLVEVTTLLRFLVMVYVPVAIYGIHQYCFGLSQFEIDYLRSGLTTTGENLYDIHPRAFSTLNSPHAFCIAMGVMFVLSLTICLNPIKAARGFLSTRGRFLLPPMFLIAGVLSLGRAGWVVSSLGLIALFAFRTKARTILFYTTFLGLFTFLVWKADFVLAKLDQIQQLLPAGSDFKDQAFRIGTYSERLFGFQNVVSNRAMWTWFGNPALSHHPGGNVAREDIVHDTLGQILVDYGFVGLITILVSLSVALIYAHRRILRIGNPSAVGLARGLLSAGVAVFFGGMLTGNHIGLFPINVLFWCMAGALVTLTKVGDRVSDDGTAGETADPRPVIAAPVPRKRRAPSLAGSASLPVRLRNGEEA